MVTEYSIADEDLHHGVVVDTTSYMTVDTVELLEDTSNLSLIPAHPNLKIKYLITNEELQVPGDTNIIEEVRDDSHLKIRYSTTTEDQTIDILEDNSNMEEITDDSKLKMKYSIVDEDLHVNMLKRIPVT